MKEPDNQEAITNDRQPPSTEHTNMPQDDDKAPRVHDHDFAPTKDDDDFLGRDHDHRANIHQSLQQRSNSIMNDKATTSSLAAKAPSLHMLPNQSVDPLQLVKQLEFTAFKYIGAASALAFLLGKWGFSLLIAIPLISIPGVLYYLFGHQPNKDLNWNIEKQEGMKSLYTAEGETVEWLNFMLEKIWRSISQEFFATIESMVEDTIQGVTPGFIKGVQICDLDIGSQAPRVQIIRMFPPLPGQSEESIFGEASFSFHAHPASTLSRERGPIEPSPPGVSIGVALGSASPIFIRGELTALKGRVRFKLTTGPDIPFVSKLTISFPSPPTVETAVMPISRHMNIMHIPMFKMMVNEGLRIGMASMIDPKSLTVDIQELMGTDAHDTHALGVAMLHIRGATCDQQMVQFKDLEDSYVTLSLSNQPKRTLSTTRVLTNDKDPRWNETLHVLISKDDISSDTKLDIRVWDADKIKYDDMWGSYSIAVRDILQSKIDRLGNVVDYCKEERVVYDGWAPLDGKPLEESKMKVDFKLSFHPKYVVSEEDSIVEKDKPKQEKQESVAMDPDHKSGILAVYIRQAMDLEIGAADELADEELKHPYNPGQVVSPYAILYINDSKVYQTRAKLRNPCPHWNGESEHFIKHFDACTLRISVKAAFELERDPVIGTKLLKLADLFKDENCSTPYLKEAQVWVPLANGIGFGKVLLTLRYKPVHLTLPPQMQGADVGTLVVDSLRLQQLNSPLDPSSHSTKATLALNVDPVILKRLKPRDLKDNVWDAKRLYFPLIMRQRSALYVHVIQGTMGGAKATGRLWLKEIGDEEWQDIVVGLHPYLSEHSKEANRNEDPWDVEGPLGQVVLRVKIIPGFSPVHTHLHMFNKDMVGADPFHAERMKAKTEAWMEGQGKEQGGSLEENASETASIKSTPSTLSTLSEEYGDEQDKEYIKEMQDMSKSHGISKYQVLRKMAWGTDIVKQQVDTLREGFNSEARLSRSVAKE